MARYEHPSDFRHTVGVRQQARLDVLAKVPKRVYDSLTDQDDYNRAYEGLMKLAERSSEESLNTLAYQGLSGYDFRRTRRHMDAGRQARLEDQAIGTNPYTGPEGIAWRYGWFRQQREMAQWSPSR